MKLAPFKSQPFPRAVRALPLQLVLIIPFVVQIFSAVGLVGYLSFKNGEKAVQALSEQLMQRTSSEVDHHLDSYLAIPHQLNRTNATALRMGLLNINDRKSIAKYFWHQMQSYDVTYISLNLTTGAAAGAARYDGKTVTIDDVNIKTPSLPNNSTTYSTDSDGNPTQVIIQGPWDTLNEPIYTEAIKAGKPTWVRIYTYYDPAYPPYVAASASQPVYDAAQKLIGTVAVDIHLLKLSEFLRALDASRSGQVFIMERNGMLVANSGQEQPFNVVGKEIQRIKASESSNPVVRDIATQLQQEIANFSANQDTRKLKLNVQGETHQVHLMPWRDAYGLEWWVVMAVPESAFMAQINANTQTTILLCLGALGLATISGIFTARWIARPLVNLNRASLAMASGDLEQTVPQGSIKELNLLAHSFNDMARQVRESFTALANSNTDLETRVKERTAELQQAKEAAEVANHTKSEFLANMNHELRTPLNGILGYAQILQRDPATPEKHHKGLSVIYQCGSHLLTLINDILDLSKLEVQKMDLYPQDFHLANFLAATTDICRIKAEQKGITFNIQLDRDLPTAIHADDKRLRQVLLNLLSNAVKFTDFGKITFTVRTIEQSSDTLTRLRFQVEDSGIGIAAEKLETIFLPFEQAAKRDRNHEGTGLGLAISQQIVQMMGSSIQVNSTLGQGTTFWFEVLLPIATDWLTQPTTQQKIIGYQGERRKILVIDDRKENRDVVIGMLAPLGFKLAEADNGQTGLEVALEMRPDLIITDVVMSRMTGLEMAQHLRQLPDFVELPIIASPATLSQVNMEDAIAAGCTSFFPKPIEFARLLGELQHRLSLQWIYEASPEPENSINVQPAVDWSVPPVAELIALYQAAQKGFMANIQQEANRLKQLDPKYAAFANKVLELTQKFDDEAILNLLQSYI